jgi:hypothetical protein
VQLTLCGYQRKSKLQKEYADGVLLNHKPVNSLRKRLRELSGYFFHDWLCSVQKLLKKRRALDSDNLNIDNLEAAGVRIQPGVAPCTLNSFI